MGLRSRRRRANFIEENGRERIREKIGDNGERYMVEFSVQPTKRNFASGLMEYLADMTVHIIG